jgi:nucleoside-diphosphate-sugar epimerase
MPTSTTNHPQRVLVTGASGYIGHHVCRLLRSRGVEVHALCREGSDLRGLDVHRHESDGSLASVDAVFANARPTGVIHLASMIKADPAPHEVAAMIEANITFGSHLIEAMVQHGCTSFVNAGTYFEFDAAGNYCPASLFAASKRAFADLLEEACLHRGIGGITLIIFDVYGPADWRGKLLPAKWLETQAWDHGCSRGKLSRTCTGKNQGCGLGGGAHQNRRRREGLGQTTAGEAAKTTCQAENVDSNQD